jgi:hypothetical protein
MSTPVEQLYSEAAKLAEEHYHMDPETTHVFFDPTSCPSDEVRLVEVTADVRDYDDQEPVFPYRFAPAPEDGVKFPVAVLLLSPSDWERIRSNSAPVYSGWSMPGILRLIPRSAA